MKKENEIDQLSKTLLIPDATFENLPKLLKDGCINFPNKRERDVFLTSALGILSECFNIQGSYMQSVNYPNLYTIICAPPASGKGAMKYAKLMGIHLDKHLLELRKARKTDDKEGNAEGKKLDDNWQACGLYIPADISDAMFVDVLKANDESGIMCESEIDTIVAVSKQEWAAGLNDKLRKIFHNETISVARKMTKSFIVLEKPKLSMVMTGTPGQIKTFIRSPENGLFSRIIYYLFSQEPKWKEQCEECDDLDKIFIQAGEEVLNIHLHLIQHPCSFKFTRVQQQKMDVVFAKQLDELNASHGSDASAMLYRMGVIVFRIAMILAALRRYEKQDTEAILVCEDLDFETAINLGTVYAAHSCVMLQLLPQSSAAEILTDKGSLLTSLPLTFDRTEAWQISKKLKIKERTMDRSLAEFVKEGLITKTAYGKYEKKT